MNYLECFLKIRKPSCVDFNHLTHKKGAYFKNHSYIESPLHLLLIYTLPWDLKALK